MFSAGYWSMPSGREREQAKREYINKIEAKRRNSAMQEEQRRAEQRKLRQIERAIDHPHPRDKNLFDADSVVEFLSFDRPFFMRRWDGQKYYYDPESRWAVRAGLATCSPAVPAEIREDYAGRMFVLPCGKEFPYQHDPHHRRMRLEQAISWYRRHSEEHNETDTAN